MRTHYVFDCTCTTGHLGFKVPTKALAHVVAWVAAKVTGHFHDYAAQLVGG